MRPSLCTPRRSRPDPAAGITGRIGSTTGGPFRVAAGSDDPGGTKGAAAFGSPAVAGSATSRAAQPDTATPASTAPPTSGPPAATKTTGAAKAPTTRPPATKATTKPAGNCNPNYSPCVPNDPVDVDCKGGGGNGPSYVQGPVRVIGQDVYGLDKDGDGIGCE
ncbi:hypothetical protein AB0H83_00290 [Dactylosporangium sp. NPDC050688]|uniref:hypothetical protein n=1 Tax=Dactylosporangium sp. NPDC050688 TaxID=3157217 RepID=UPI003400173D